MQSLLWEERKSIVHKRLNSTTYVLHSQIIRHPVLHAHYENQCRYQIEIPHLTAYVMQFHYYAYLHPSGAPITTALSIHTYETAQELLKRISLNLMLRNISKICRFSQIPVKIGQTQWTVHTETPIPFRKFLEHKYLEREMLHTRAVQHNKAFYIQYTYFASNKVFRKE
jgi:hypothetical protein